MWRVLSLVIGVSACYQPSVAPGTPCEPAAGCPYGLTCALVDGAHVCIDGLPPTDAPLLGPDGPDTDAPDAPAAVPWRIVQTQAIVDRVLMVEATGAGNTILVGLETTAGAVPNNVRDNAGNTYTRIPGSRARNVERNFAAEFWIATNVQAGATRLDSGGGIIRALAMWEVAGLAADPIDAIAVLENQAESTLPVGAPITTAEAGELVVSIVIVASSVTGLAPGSDFTNDHNTLGNGWAHLTATDAPAAMYQAQWLQQVPGGSCATSIALRRAP
ncbi:MAG: hypothetical protein KF773_39040 [Deltaproteobacteria bacterium]|nr:hypothetical protein [Deltaproteobacteria bacterium]